MDDYVRNQIWGNAEATRRLYRCIYERLRNVMRWRVARVKSGEAHRLGSIVRLYLDVEYVLENILEERLQ